MHAGDHYRVTEFVLWTRWDIYRLIPMSVIPTILHQFAGMNWLGVPWVPIALIGTATAFIVGFRNTQTYSRLWEARQIWGSIVNSSRAWGMMVRDFVKTDKATKMQLLRMHFAWLTCLRYQLRESRVWEHLNTPYNKEYLKYYTIPEHETKLEDELTKYLAKEELEFVLQRKNRAAQILMMQSKTLADLKQKNLIDAFEYVEMEKRLADLVDHQGRCERIKNFPYPRQFSSISVMFTWLFVFILPFGMLNEFAKLGETFVWLTVPFSITVSWVFTSLERVGESSENPFEGCANDVPISALSRSIEIDLRDMMGETDLPPALQPVNNILM